MAPARQPAWTPAGPPTASITEPLRRMKIELRDPHKLRPHKLHRHLPEPDQTTPEWFSFADELHAAGLDQIPPVIITDTGFVMDGWRRVLAAQAWQWPQIRCQVRPDDDAALIIVGSLFGSRDMSRGAKVYFAIPLLPDYAEAAEKRRLANLRKGAKTNEKPLIFPNSSDWSSGPAVTAICERLGIHQNTWFSALQLRDLLHNPKSEGLLQLLGRKAKVGELEKIQADLRKEFEPQLASGEKGIWFVRSAIAGRLTTEETPRQDTKPLQLDFWTRHLHSLRTGLQSWRRLPADLRSRVKLEFRGILEALPEEDQREIVEAILAEA